MERLNKKNRAIINRYCKIRLLYFSLFILLICALLPSCQNSSTSDSNNHDSEKELTETKSDATLHGNTSSNFNKLTSLSQISDSLQLELRKNALGFSSDMVPMSETKTYSEGSTNLTRKYTWDIGFPVTIGMGNVQVSPKKGADKILVTIDKLIIGKRFSFGNKKATTISQESWKVENSEDEAFWKMVDQVSKRKMNPAVLNNKTVTNALRNKAINVVIQKINEVLEGSKAEENEFEFIIQRITF